VNRGTAFTQVIGLAASIFSEAQQRGEVPAHLNPMLAAAMLFGAIEMGLTAFVAGLLDKRDEAVVTHARDQVIETILNGLVGARPNADAAPVWADKSPSKSKPVRRE
jgi:TetR/AcrR family fatty acid metabolism transcriptional regulator